MRASDLPFVLSIERDSFPSPWRREHFLHELERNPFAWSRVVEIDGRIVAYACLWTVDQELAINNLAVHPRERRRGVGCWFLERLLAEAVARGCTQATLEVRPSNAAARRLYARYGFRETARRSNYYAVEGEDAIVMTADLERPDGVESGGASRL
jgi:ribosomal-protein-alanine N-acetyltransferase